MIATQDRVLAQVAAANPVHEADVVVHIDRAWRDELLLRILEQPTSAARRRHRRRPRSRLLLAAAVAAVLLAAPAYALGRTVVDWVIGDPAPPAVVEDFGKYTPQLGFNPEPGKAVVVAKNGDVALYVTTNKQGTWCFIVSTRFDGGTCASRAIAAAPVVAGVAGSGVVGADGLRQLIVIGRVQDERARAVTFTGPDGATVTRRLGLGGFFVATVPAATASGALCPQDGWAPTFTFTGADGESVRRATIRLVFAHGDGDARVCQFPSLAQP